MNESAVVDDLSIREVLTRYCRAVDRCDKELLKSVYWPEATDDHIIFNGNAMEFIEVVIPLLNEKLAGTQHLIGNVWLQLHGASACAETYVQAYHRMRDGSADVVVGGRYLDRLEKRQGEWRIAERKFVVDWEQNAAVLFGGPEATRQLLDVERRNRDEDSYRLFARKTLRTDSAPNEQ